LQSNPSFTVAVLLGCIGFDGRSHRHTLGWFSCFGSFQKWFERSFKSKFCSIL